MATACRPIFTERSAELAGLGHVRKCSRTPCHRLRRYGRGRPGLDGRRFSRPADARRDLLKMSRCAATAKEPPASPSLEGS
jgi:hypothetical protein